MTAQNEAESRGSSQFNIDLNRLSPANNSKEQNWLKDLSNMFAREARRAEVAFTQCSSKFHEEDDVLDGFANNSVMQGWFSSHGSVLCCWLETGRRVDHTHMAKCILCKVLNSDTHGRHNIFLYDHEEGTAVELPNFYLCAKAEALKTTKGEGLVALERRDTKEIVLLSFAMQVKARGFDIPLQAIDFSGPTQLIDSLIFLIVEALHPVPEHVFLVLEWPSSTTVTAVSETLDVINGLLSISRNRNLSHNCSVIMSVRETPGLLRLLKDYPSVRPNSEYKGMPFQLDFALGQQCATFMLSSVY